MKQIITSKTIAGFKTHLTGEEKSSATIEKYLKNISAFAKWLDGKPVTKEMVVMWKEYLRKTGHAPITVNGYLSALHSYFSFMNWTDCTVKYLKVQKQLFKVPARQLNREEYRRLVKAAERQGNNRTALVMETISGTGIRVSELPFITVEAVRNRKAEINLKGKIRTVIIPKNLAVKLRRYAMRHGISDGHIFVTRSGKPLDRSNICHDMKVLCKSADVDSRKVFPHNLRHLFARSYYALEKDIARLADILGHSSVETTRIYVATCVAEHEKTLEKMRLIM